MDYDTQRTEIDRMDCVCCAPGWDGVSLITWTRRAEYRAKSGANDIRSLRDLNAALKDYSVLTILDPDGIKMQR